ncbi:hypothetical protein D9611_009672 [Ephemerocybe angulata]|uniref:Uncharacterized protein n=1 Tax=Ephemerocybe angulata TaxID=980116 RepID=A0A8H5C645_9AGAR|nr:hypothetical protein D9611_009672 [Tulosesus angulatus]
MSTLVVPLPSPALQASRGIHFYRDLAIPAPTQDDHSCAAIPIGIFPPSVIVRSPRPTKYPSRLRVSFSYLGQHITHITPAGMPYHQVSRSPVPRNATEAKAKPARD